MSQEELVAEVRNILDKSPNQALKNPVLAMILAAEAYKIFPRRDWSNRDHRLDLERFVYVGLEDFLHSKSFANTPDLLYIQTEFDGLVREFNDLAHNGGCGSNWSKAELLVSKIKSVARRDPSHPAVLRIQQQLMPLITDKSLMTFLVVTLSMLLSALVTAYLTSLMVVTAHRKGTLGQSYFTDGLEVIIGILLFSLTSRFLSKRMHTLRVPRINPNLAPMAVAMSIFTFIVYAGGYNMFVNHFLNWPTSIEITWKTLIAGAKEKWLFSAPFVVIVFYILTAFRFAIIPKYVSEGVEGLGEIGDKISFAFIFIVSCLISMLLRILFIAASALPR